MEKQNRNDQCNCGSNMKYKNCCGKPHSENSNGLIMDLGGTKKNKTTSNNQNTSSNIVEDILNQHKAQGGKVLVRTEKEPLTAPMQITFCYKSNTIHFEGGFYRELNPYFQLMKGKEKLMLDQVENWNNHFSCLSEELKSLWCLNIYCLTKVGIIKNDYWNGVVYLVVS